MKGLGIATLAFVFAPSLSFAGGTIALSEVDPLLRQKPALRKFLTSSLDLNDTVMAAIRFGPQFKHLSGARMGPYMVEGRPKGSEGRNTVEVVLCTDAKFVDETGRAAESETTATRVEEKLTVVMLREAGGMPAVPTCPGS